MSDSEAEKGEVFELKRIRQLVELMKEFDLREVDLRQADQRIRLSRGVESAPINIAPMAASQPVAPSPAAAASRPAADNPNIVYIKSPMVGTFYSRPNPNAAPFVKVGDHIEPEKTVCIIEAMKVFTELPAEVRGKIVAVLVSDEEPVEFGKPLYKVDTSG